METDLPALLPADVLADVLRRLSPRGLAACRRVCKAWRAIIDGHRLLRAELLPRSLAGIFINFDGLDISEFFSRPPAVPSDRVFLRDNSSFSWYYVQDHCNGLLLLHGGGVLNPATRWQARLPPPPPPRMGSNSFEYGKLVYDPTVAPHYEVILIPYFIFKRNPEDFPHRQNPRDEYDPVVEQSEWPPSQCVLNVFSSKMERWEPRSFVREGKPAGTVDDMRSHILFEKDNAIYWQGVLYVHCQTDFLMRISLSDSKLQVIKFPFKSYQEGRYVEPHVGKSEKGVYCASSEQQCKLKIWHLDESCCDGIGWVLKHDTDLIDWFAKHDLMQQRKVRGPWILQDINNYYDRKYRQEQDVTTEVCVEENFEWDSGDDEELEQSSDNDDGDGREYYEYIEILGFHPYKEIIFLGENLRRGFAYHWNTSKVQDLGSIWPTGYEAQILNEQEIKQCFPYTPCWM